MNIYVLGDSISIHYGPYLERALAGWAHYARKGGPDASGTDWENPADANGGDSHQVAEFLARNLPAIDADILLLNCGLHDLRVHPKSGAHQVPPESYRLNLEGLIPPIRAAGIRPVWITTTPVIDEVHQRFDLPYRRFARDVLAYHAIAVRVMTACQVPIIDLGQFSQSLGPDSYLDHVHFKDEVRAQQADFIAHALRSLLAAD